MRADPSHVEAGVELAGVVRRFPRAHGTVLALDDVDAALVPGALTVIAGPSGSGKSTLLRIVALVDRVDAGVVRFDGADVTNAAPRRRRALRRRRIGYVGQQPAANLVDYLDAAEHVRLGARLRGGTGRDVDELLDLVGLAGRRDHRPAQLSSGEQQRLGFAFAVAGGPAALVADEPTAALDHAAGRLVVDALAALAARGLTVVASSHDPAVVERADHVIHLDHGRVTR